MKVSVLLHPSNLGGTDLNRRAAVVFDVLRATTTITAALAAGVNPIYVFDRLDDARQQAGPPGPDRILAGERKCIAPEGFDRGNSPRGFVSADSGKPMFLATTNGTRALAAVAAAPLVLVGALVNAAAVAEYLIRAGRDVLLLCAGTDGAISMEDLLGAGAVLQELSRRGAVELEGDLPRIALRLFAAARSDLSAVLTDAQGGRNVIAAGLADDIAFAARLNSLPIVGQLRHDPLRIVPAWT